VWPRSGTNTLGIIFFCIFFGTVLGSMPGRRAVPIVKFFRVLDEVGVMIKYLDTRNMCTFIS
jgi:Na+/H+-dicarboxylate symporter